MKHNTKKSLYLFLSGFLGSLMFLALHRIIVFFLVVAGIFSGAEIGYDRYLQYAAIDYLTLGVAVLGGFWYGLWLGKYWFEKVYVSGISRGAVSHIVGHFKKNTELDKIKTVTRHLETDLQELESLAEKHNSVLRQKPKSQTK